RTNVELHPREPLTSQHVLQTLPLRHDKGGHVDQHDDTTLLAVLSPSSIFQTLHGSSTDQPAVRVDNHDDLSPLIGQALEHRVDMGNVAVQAFGGRFSANGRQGHGLGLEPSLGHEPPDGIEGFWQMPGAGDEHENGSAGVSHCSSDLL
ncbi:hypothetical protein T310_9790, partial [Rasamsonia emersonii CBS 393.64]